MDVMGWSSAAMVECLPHVTARLRRDIADRLNTYLWSATETGDGYGGPMPLTSGHHACSEVAARDRIVFRPSVFQV
jgi:hypothetical protein